MPDGVLLIELRWTFDVPVVQTNADGGARGWVFYPDPPQGEGWVVSDMTQANRTCWRRISLKNREGAHG